VVATEDSHIKAASETAGQIATSGSIQPIDPARITGERKMDRVKTLISGVGLIVALLTGLAMVPTKSWAEGEAALYDASAPPGSAFVRVINYGPDTLEVSTAEKSGAQRISSFQVGEYLFLTGGNKHAFSLSGQELNQHLAKDSATTLVVTPAGVTALEDTYFTGRKKALESFYNLTSKPLALKTEDGKHAVVATLQGLSNGQRKINEIKIGLAAWDDSSAVATFPPVFLKKGRSYSYVVYEEEGLFKPLVTADAISTIE
jgi:alginate O-acetyltransferase complex protein AlgF